MFLFDDPLYDLIGVVSALFLGFYTFAKYRYTYWSRKGLYSNPTVFPFGNGKDSLTLKKSFAMQFKDIYLDLQKKGLKHGGAYFMLKPMYVPVDVNIIKSIMQNDFSHFINHGTYVNEKDDPLTGHLFALEDERWKTVRAKLTPTFTSGKMKMMFSTLVDCSVGLDQLINDHSKTGEDLNIKEVLQRFTIEIISSCAFGVASNSIKNPDSDFAVNGKAVFEPTFKNSIRNLLTFFINHDVLRFFKHKVLDEKATSFFMNMVQSTVDYREKNNVYRKDFMHLLLQLKNRGNVFDGDEKFTSEDGKQGLTMNELTAQAFVFFIAGYETSSTAMTFALFELAQRPDLQEKMREEINRVITKHDGKLTYDGIMEMTYLDQVLNESLRKYPPVPIIRKCNKDYKVPGHDVVIEKGIDVLISTSGIHHNPEYYPDPEKFDPDRFTEENKAKRPAYAWIPFGEGPRICIGLRFGVMQAKVGLITMLRNYTVSLSKKTKVPLKIDPKSFILTAEGGVWIHAQKV